MRKRHSNTLPRRKFLQLGLNAFALAALPFHKVLARPVNGETELTWYGHSAFKLRTPSGKILWIDPWISNPANGVLKKGSDPLELVDKADYILLTHGHSDHVGETLKMANKTKAKLVAPFDLGDAMVKALHLPAEQAGFDTLGNPGGAITIANDEVKVNFVQAIHSSNLDLPDKSPAIYGGIAVGYVIQIQNGPVIYDSGDTAYFSDMKLIGDKFKPDVAIINIGGHFGMEVPEAVKAAKDIGAKITIPQHYGTFPILTARPDDFVKGVKQSGLKTKIMTPGESISFKGVALK